MTRYDSRADVDAGFRAVVAAGFNPDYEDKPGKRDPAQRHPLVRCRGTMSLEGFPRLVEVLDRLDSVVMRERDDDDQQVASHSVQRIARQYPEGTPMSSQSGRQTDYLAIVS